MPSQDSHYMYIYICRAYIFFFFYMRTAVLLRISIVEPSRGGLVQNTPFLCLRLVNERV